VTGCRSPPRGGQSDSTRSRPASQERFAWSWGTTSEVPLMNAAGYPVPAWSQGVLQALPLQNIR
jgi:hypothetical protein